MPGFFEMYAWRKNSRNSDGAETSNLRTDEWRRMDELKIKLTMISSYTHWQIEERNGEKARIEMDFTSIYIVDKWQEI